MNRAEENTKIILANPNHLISPLEQEKVCYEYVIGDEISAFFKDHQGKVYEVKDEFHEQGNYEKGLKELYFILGINSVQEIAELLKETNPSSIFIIYEPLGEFLGHVLRAKDLAVLMDTRVILIVQSIDEFRECVRDIIRGNPSFIPLYGNLRFYATYFYRHYRLDLYKEFVKLISEQIQAFMHINGNSLEDSLRGFQQNAANGEYLLKSKDVSLLRQYFAGKPAFVVAAGPSLDKNIQELKKVKGHGLIFAVDTIATRLIAEGIVPDFICTIERDDVIYDYFYKERHIPQDVALVAPLVLYPEVFKQFKGEMIIPLRQLREYWWWNKIYQLPEDAYVEQGSSCAHLAFGMALKMGCEPIAFVGQDLAYGAEEGMTHAGGTVYEEMNRDLYAEVGVRRLQTEGYYGELVETNNLWNDFRLWFEAQIRKNEVLVINSTEGGAKIAGAVPLPLHEVVLEHCQEKVEVQALLKECLAYNLDKKILYQRLHEEVEELQREREEFLEHFKMLEAIQINAQSNDKKLLKVLGKLQTSGAVLQSIIDKQFLVAHFMQPEMAATMIAVSRIKQELSYDSVSANLRIQLRFFGIAIIMLEAALHAISENCRWLEPVLENEEYGEGDV